MKFLYLKKLYKYTQIDELAEKQNQVFSKKNTRITTG